MKGSTVLGVAAGLGVVGIGLALAGRKSSGPPFRLPEETGGGGPSGPTGTDADREQVIRVALEGVSAQLPGVKESVELLASSYLENPAATVAVLRRFKAQSELFSAAQQKRAATIVARLNKAREVLRGLAVADNVFEQVGKIPVVGQIIAGIYQIARPFAEAAAEAKAQGNELFDSNWRPGGAPLATGWAGNGSTEAGSGDYLLQDVPVLSFAVPIMVPPFLEYSEKYAPQMLAFWRLALGRPFGLPVPSVEVTATGQYVYRFNVSGNNDVSQAAIDAGQVFGPTVWNPADISATGPRGFRADQPRAWFGPAREEALREGWIDPKASPYFGDL